VEDGVKANWRGDTLAAMEKAPDAQALQALVTRAARHLGFDYCAYGLRTELPLSNPRTIMVNNYPTAWQSRYASQGYLAVDPTVAHGMMSLRPLLWSESVFAAARPLWEDARAHA